MTIAPSDGEAFIFGMECPDCPEVKPSVACLKDNDGGGARSCKGKGPGFGGDDCYVLTFQGDSLREGKYDFGGRDDDDESGADGYGFDFSSAGPALPPGQNVSFKAAEVEVYTIGASSESSANNEVQTRASNPRG